MLRGPIEGILAWVQSRQTNEFPGPSTIGSKAPNSAGAFEIQRHDAKRIPTSGRNPFRRRALKPYGK